MDLSQCTAPIDGSLSSCNPVPKPTFAFVLIWFVSFFVVIILVIAQKRVGRLCPKCCWGRPGLPLPIDFLVSPRRRFMYTILFANMGASIISGYNNYGFSLEADDVYTKLFNKILWSPFFTVLTQVLEYFPLFATVEFPHPCLGFSIGWIYSVIWYCNRWIPRFIEYQMYVATCSSNAIDNATVAAVVMQDLPLILLGAFVVIWFFFMMAFRCCWRPCPCYKKKTAELHALDNWRYGIRAYHLDRVRQLLRKPVVKEHREISSNKIVNKVFMYLGKAVRYLFPFKRNYKLPLPLLGAIVAMVMIIYQLSCGWIAVVFTFLVQFKHYYKACVQPFLSNVMGSTYVDAVNDIADSLLTGVPAVFAVAPFVALFFAVFLLIHLVASVSKEIKQVSKHGFNRRLPKRVRRLSGFWKYVGVQVGLFIYAWVAYTIIFTLIGLILIIAHFFFKYPQPRDWFLNFLLGIVVPLIWAGVIFLIQTLICLYGFMSDRKEKDSKFIAITNRRMYNWFAFVLFFYNGFAGLVSAAVRMLISIVVSLCFMFRIDKLTLPLHLWRLDTGHKTYLSFLYMDYCYNNPVMHVFSHILENSINKEKCKAKEAADVELVGADQLEEVTPAKTHLARNRWLVAYTLVRNPSIQKYTAKNIQLLLRHKEKEKKREEEEANKVFVLEDIIREDKLSEESDFSKRELVEEKGVEVQPSEGKQVGEEEVGDEEIELSLDERFLEDKEEPKEWIGNGGSGIQEEEPKETEFDRRDEHD